jgi:hypothetical protein
MKKQLTQCITMGVCLWFAASSQAALLVDLNAANSGSNTIWENTATAFPGWYEDDDQNGAPVKNTDVNGVTYFSTATAEGGQGFIGGDDSGGTQQHPSGNEPQFNLNGTNPGDFTFEVWMRKRGNRIGPTATILGMKSANADERFILHLWDSDGAESLMDIGMKAGGTQVYLLDQFNFPNRGDTDPFEHFVFTWDNSASTMDLFHEGTNGVSNMSFPGVTFSALTVFDGTTLFNSFANSASGNNRFNGDIARVRIHDEILTLDNIVDNFLLGPNGTVDPVDADAITLEDVVVLQYTSNVASVYHLEFTTDLINSSSWQRAGANITGDGNVQFLYDPAGNDTNKAYRIITE